MEPQLLVLLSAPTTGTHRQPSFHTRYSGQWGPYYAFLGQASGGPWWAPRYLHINQESTLSGFFTVSSNAWICSGISSPQPHRQSTPTFLGFRPRNIPRLRPQSTPALEALAAPGLLSPRTFNHPSLHAFLLIIFQVCVQAQAWKIGSSHQPSSVDF